MVMVSLIGVQHKKTERVASIPIPEIAPPHEEVVEAKVIEKPEKPPVEQTPPPEVTKQPFDELAVATELTIVDTATIKVAPEIKSNAGSLVDGDFGPVVKPAPVYPVPAATKGIQGDVIVEYTVTKSGSVRDAVIISSSSALFNKAALASAMKYRYRPRVINGTAVDVAGVRTVIKFRLEE